jgi:hypothetical protein
MSLFPPDDSTCDYESWLTGNSLAMAEMTTLVAAIYRKYKTTPMGDFGTVSPGITGRYEVFYDETCSKMRVCSANMFLSETC